MAELLTAAGVSGLLVNSIRKNIGHVSDGLTEVGRVNRHRHIHT